MEDVRKQGVESLFCPYEQALILKELGFDEKCFGFYDLSYKCRFAFTYDQNFYEQQKCSAPTFSQAFRFFREQLLLDSCIIPYWFIDGEYKVKKYTYSIEPSNRFDEYFDCDSDEYDTYEDVEIECLKKLIEITKEQNVK